LKQVLPLPEIGRPADALSRIPRDDQPVSLASLIATVLLLWLAVSVAVGMIVGRGIAFGTRSSVE
jgi:hypothetical protein